MAAPAGMPLSGSGVRMVWRGELVRQIVHEAADQSAKASAEAVLQDANYHVPYKDGTLMDSGDVAQARDSAGHFAAEWLVYYNTVYAVRLHENPQFNFRPPGEGKWLENALKRHMSRMLPTMAEPLVKAFRLP